MDVEAYSPFHLNVRILTNCALDFFRTCKYNSDVADVKVAIASNALHTNLSIYQNHYGKGPPMQYTARSNCKEINNILHSLANHCDAIVNISQKEIEEYERKLEKPQPHQENGPQICNRQ